MMTDGPVRDRTPIAPPPRRRSWTLRAAMAICVTVVAALFAFKPLIQDALSDDTSHVLVSSGGTDQTE